MWEGGHPTSGIKIKVQHLEEIPGKSPRALGDYLHDTGSNCESGCMQF